MPRPAKRTKTAKAEGGAGKGTPPAAPRKSSSTRLCPVLAAPALREITRCWGTTTSASAAFASTLSTPVLPRPSAPLRRVSPCRLSRAARTHRTRTSLCTPSCQALRIGMTKVGRRKGQGQGIDQGLGRRTWRLGLRRAEAEGQAREAGRRHQVEAGRRTAEDEDNKDDVKPKKFRAKREVKDKDVKPKVKPKVKRDQEEKA
ncbi:hypothetical protein GGR56DRAFT_174141 [Xylariaceae sp. FL0804]|nr:hypothetical protein GGR56DRAFT_174141 [Xylariaceae sp. FL0804]